MDTQKTKQKNSFNNGRYPFKKGNGNSRRRRGRFERPKPEFEQKIVSIRRVTRVVKGGRRMTFAVAMAIGDKKGSVGLGTGKGVDTAIAINKAVRQAKKNMFRIKTTKEMSIPHSIKVKYASSKLELMPNRGRGLVAGSTVRDMFTLAGLKNVTAKLNSRSKNKLNNARVAYKALSELKSNTLEVPKSGAYVSNEVLNEKEGKEEKENKNN